MALSMSSLSRTEPEPGRAGVPADDVPRPEKMRNTVLHANPLFIIRNTSFPLDRLNMVVKTAIADADRVVLSESEVWTTASLA